MTKGEIVLLWLAGLWALLVLWEAPIVQTVGFLRHTPYASESAKAIFAGWIPLALLALTLRFWPRR